MAQKLDTWRDSPPNICHQSRRPSLVSRPEVDRFVERAWRGTKKVHPYLASRMGARARCLDAAMETIQTISSFVGSSESSLQPGITWYGKYFIFQAMLVLEVSYLNRGSQPELVSIM